MDLAHQRPYEPDDDLDWDLQDDIHLNAWTILAAG